MNNKDVNLESLVKGGLIGAALGALLAKDKEEGAVIGALLGAAISATFTASEEAKKTNVAVSVAEGGQLFEILPTGEKRFIKNIKKPSQNLPEQFKLK